MIPTKCNAKIGKSHTAKRSNNCPGDEKQSNAQRERKAGYQKRDQKQQSIAPHPFFFVAGIIRKGTRHQCKKRRMQKRKYHQTTHPQSNVRKKITSTREGDLCRSDV